MPQHVEGRRVGGYDEIERGGDYFLTYDADRRITAVIFAMPGFGDGEGSMWNRINGPASTADGPKWEVSEDAEGRVTASPSILSWWKFRGEDRRFHAFLKGGVWELLDDCEFGR